MAQSVARVRPDRARGTRASRGSTRSPPTARATRTTRCRARSPPSATRRAPACNAFLRPGPTNTRPPGARTDPAPPATGRPSPRRPVAPGTFAPDEVPTLIRRDYVHQRQRQPLALQPRATADGLRARIIGIENAERSPTGLASACGSRCRSASPAPTGCRAGDSTGRPLQPASRSATACPLGELWRDRLVQFCNAAPAGTLVGLERAGLQLGPPRATSSGNGTCATTSTRRGRCSSGASPRDLLARPSPSAPHRDCRARSRRARRRYVFTQPYSRTPDPVNTPRGLNIADPLRRRRPSRTRSPTSRALASPLTPGCATTSGPSVAGSGISIHGGPHDLGNFNVISAPWGSPEQGYEDIVHGSSFIMAAQFTPASGARSAPGTFVTYSEGSENQGRSTPLERLHAAPSRRKRWHAAPVLRVRRPPPDALDEAPGRSG